MATACCEGAGGTLVPPRSGAASGEWPAQRTCTDHARTVAARRSQWLRRTACARAALSSRLDQVLQPA
eukprot:2224809-Prymnesium_polylepis.1